MLKHRCPHAHGFGAERIVLQQIDKCVTEHLRIDICNRTEHVLSTREVNND